MRFSTALALSLFAGSVSTAALADAPSEKCGPRAAFVEKLTTKFGEERQAGKLVDGVVIEFWASASGSWTMFATTPANWSCLLDAGQGARIPSPGEPA